MEAIPKGAEVFVSYNFPLEGSSGWYRRQYEAVVAQGLGHLVAHLEQKTCTSEYQIK